MSRITAHALALLHHALGLTADKRESSRNHFVAGAGHHAITDLEILETVGFMVRSDSSLGAKNGDILFRCTQPGRAYALAHLPRPLGEAKKQFEVTAHDVPAFA